MNSMKGLWHEEIVQEFIMNEEQKRKISVEKLIAFFRGLSGKKPGTKKEYYKGWDQTEEEYQKEQEEWLRQMEEKKRGRKKNNPNSGD